MMDYTKYKRQYYMPPVPCMEWTKKEYIEKAPVWCSVDLRDGNQALVDVYKRQLLSSVDDEYGDKGRHIT